MKLQLGVPLIQAEDENCDEMIKTDIAQVISSYSKIHKILIRQEISHNTFAIFHVVNHMHSNAGFKTVQPNGAGIIFTHLLVSPSSHIVHTPLGCHSTPKEAQSK